MRIYKTTNKINGKIYIGWSLCKRGDKFNKHKARTLADNSVDAILYEYQHKSHNVPDTIQRAIKNTGFTYRCRRYFKTPIVCLFPPSQKRFRW